MLKCGVFKFTETQDAKQSLTELLNQNRGNDSHNFLSKHGKVNK